MATSEGAAAVPPPPPPDQRPPTPVRSSAAATEAIPWTTRLGIRFGMAVRETAWRPDGTVNRRLLRMFDPTVPARPKPDSHGVRSVDVVYDPLQRLWLRLYSPSSAPSTAKVPIVVYYHGGGFVELSAALRPYDSFCRRLCAGLASYVASVEYRLAPEHPYPAAYDDGLAALRFIASGGLSASLAPNLDLRSAFLSGDSAGGNLAHHVATRWVAAAAADQTLRVAGVILLQPFFGGEERTPSERRLDGVQGLVLSLRKTDRAWRSFLPAGADRDHQAAHVVAVEASAAARFPPAMVVVGGLDLLQDWQRKYCEALKSGGVAVSAVEYPGAFHGFYVFPDVPDARAVVKEMAEFVSTHRSAPDLEAN